MDADLGLARRPKRRWLAWLFNPRPESRRTNYRIMSEFCELGAVRCKVGNTELGDAIGVRRRGNRNGFVQNKLKLSLAFLDSCQALQATQEQPEGGMQGGMRPS